jgi:hypothetical protein
MTNTADEALDVAFEMAADLYESGVMDGSTMEKVQMMCFPAEKALSPKRGFRDDDDPV